MRPTKSIPDPNSGKRTLRIEGIGYHKPTNRYRIRFKQRDKTVTEYFPATAAGLEAAKRRRAELDRQPVLPLLPGSDLGAEITLIERDELGYLDHHLPDGPILVAAEGDDEEIQLNPEWLKAIPAGRRERAVLDALPRQPGPPPVGDTDNPTGERLTISQVGKLYREWYASEHCDLSECARQADAYNARIAEQNALVQAKRKARLASGGVIPKNSRPFRLIPKRTWLHYAPRSARKHYRDHTRYYDEFVRFLGDKTIDVITGEDLRSYYDHCRQLARSRAKPAIQPKAATAKSKSGGSMKRKKRLLTNPDRWVNHHLQAVTGAFRRVKKRYPSAAWARGLFGEDGLLAILEQRKTTTEGRKVLITPAEFRALVDVSDAQWRALLKLALNGALKNSDMAIPWSAIDFDRKLMDYPRPKNGRKRITPLAPETIAALKAWRTESRSQRPEIFVTKEGTPWIGTTDSIAKHWELLCNRVEDKTGHRIPASFDSLRKTPATTILAAGVPNAKEAIQFLLGHKPNEAWRYYVGVAPECLNPAIALVRERFLARPTAAAPKLPRASKSKKRKPS